MTKAYIIEVHDRTAGIIARDAHGFRFFSSERLFDSLEGRQFRSARDAERAARGVLRAAPSPQSIALRHLKRRR